MEQRQARNRAKMRILMGTKREANSECSKLAFADFLSALEYMGKMGHSQNRRNGAKLAPLQAKCPIPAKTGFRTPKYRLPFKVLSGLEKH